jgi:hypothetical protein
LAFQRLLAKPVFFVLVLARSLQGNLPHPTKTYFSLSIWAFWEEK